jgi:MacB-like periplasmic core domain
MRFLRQDSLFYLLQLVTLCFGFVLVAVCISFITADASARNRFESGLTARVFSLIDARDDIFADILSPGIRRLGVQRLQHSRFTPSDMGQIEQLRSEFVDPFLAESAGFFLKKDTQQARSVYSVSRNYPQLMQLRLLRGSWPSNGAYALAQPELAITDRFAQEYFAQTDPVGKTITANSDSDIFDTNPEAEFKFRTYIVVAVFATPHGNDRFANFNFDTIGFIPHGIIRNNCKELFFLSREGKRASAIEQIDQYRASRWQNNVSISKADGIIERYRLNAGRRAIIASFYALSSLFMVLVIIFQFSTIRVRLSRKPIFIARALGASRSRIVSVFLQQMLIKIGLAGVLGLAIFPLFVQRINDLLQGSSEALELNAELGSFLLSSACVGLFFVFFNVIPVYLSVKRSVVETLQE